MRDVRGILEDPQYQALGTALTVDEEDLGPLVTQIVLLRLSATPGEVRWAEGAPAADTDQVLAQAGLSPEETARLRAKRAV